MGRGRSAAPIVAMVPQHESVAPMSPCAARTEQVDNVLMPVLRGPCQRSCPGLGIRFPWVRTARKVQLNEINSPPAAGPAKRRGLEERISLVGRCPGIQQHPCPRDSMLLVGIIALRGAFARQPLWRRSRRRPAASAPPPSHAALGRSRGRSPAACAKSP